MWSESWSRRSRRSEIIAPRHPRAGATADERVAHIGQRVVQHQVLEADRAVVLDLQAVVEVAERPGLSDARVHGVAGEVGDYVVMARQERGGPDWYVGALTDEQERELTVPLAFLSDGTKYIAEVYRDRPDAHWWDNPYDILIEQRTVTAGDSLQLPLGASGGAAIRLRPAN